LRLLLALVTSELSTGRDGFRWSVRRSSRRPPHPLPPSAPHHL